MPYYEVSFQSVRFLSIDGNIYFVLGRITVFDLSHELGSALCFCGYAKGGVKPISHAVFSVSPKLNVESLNKFYIMWNNK